MRWNRPGHWCIGQRGTSRTDPEPGDPSSIVPACTARIQRRRRTAGMCQACNQCSDQRMRLRFDGCPSCPRSTSCNSAAPSCLGSGLGCSACTWASNARPGTGQWHSPCRRQQGRTGRDSSASCKAAVPSTHRTACRHERPGFLQRGNAPASQCCKTSSRRPSCPTAKAGSPRGTFAFCTAAFETEVHTSCRQSPLRA